jgi:hypothetical protein
LQRKTLLCDREKSHQLNYIWAAKLLQF